MVDTGSGIKLNVFYWPEYMAHLYAIDYGRPRKLPIRLYFMLSSYVTLEASTRLAY